VPVVAPASPGLFDIPGASAARAVADAEAEQRDLAAALRRAHRRASNYRAAALSEPQTAAALAPLADQGWRILHDRRWPGSTTGANVDHLAIGPGGVFVIDSKHWSGTVQVRDGRLWCGDDDRHDDTIDTILRLTDAVSELLLEVAGSDPGLDVGLSPINITPVLVFTRHHRANTFSPHIGRVWLCTLTHLPIRLARHRRLTADQVALVGEYLAREMPPTLTTTEPDPNSGPVRAVDVPAQRVVGVPITPRPAPPVPPEPPPEPLFDPVELAEQLTRAAALPIADWMGFLHPTQARLVRRSFTGPARVRGPAGTGKTVVLLHRAAWLASLGTGRILVTSYVHTLPRQLAVAYARLSPDTTDRVDFLNIHRVARELLRRNGQRYPVNYDRVERLFTRAWARAGQGTVLEQLAPARYWREEIDHVIKGRGLRDFDQYRELDRPGRGLPLTTAHKHAAWTLLDAYQDGLDRAVAYDSNDQLSAALNLITHQAPDPGWSAVLVDEVQDLPLLGLRLCRTLAGDRPNALFLAGDGQQALYPGGFTLGDAGISVTGRATVLRTNYRNTRPIIDTARALVADHDFHDLDTTPEPGDQPVEILRDGPPVHTTSAPTREALTLLLRQAIRTHTRTGINPGDSAILCHERWELTYLAGRLTELDIPYRDLTHWTGEPDHRIKIGTINRSKGLDFAAVYLVDLSRPQNPDTDDTAPKPHPNSWEELRAKRDYVAYTRPRDHLWIGRIRRQIRTT
jgi:hypothetical protein